MKIPVTSATRYLKAHNAEYTSHLYAYEERGGTEVSARELGVPEHAVIKTLVFEDDLKRPLVILMHGDRQVSARGLARAIGARSTQPCRPEVAEKHSGYKVGGTSPLGLKKSMPIYAESSILELEKLYINGGLRGFLVGLTPQQLEQLLPLRWVEVGRD